jgi:hypothetical protein
VVVIHFRLVNVHLKGSTACILFYWLVGRARVKCGVWEVSTGKMRGDLRDIDQCSAVQYCASPCTPHFTITPRIFTGEFKNAERPECRMVQHETEPECRKLVHMCNTLNLSSSLTKVTLIMPCLVFIIAVNLGNKVIVYQVSPLTLQVTVSFCKATHTILSPSVPKTVLISEMSLSPKLWRELVT